MVKIRAIKAYRPVDAESFSIPPYDVIEEDMEKELKKNPNSSIHVILPDGEGDEVYTNAEIKMKELIDKNVIIQEEKPSIYLYQQQEDQFVQEGLILGASIDDYEEGLIKKHEHTREKPLKDRTAHISATKMNTGLVWTVYKWNQEIQDIIEKIKEQEPVAKFQKYGYLNTLWKVDDEKTISELQHKFKDIPLYIADGHHRAASAAAFRQKTKSSNANYCVGEEKSDYFMVYAASDEQVRILPYNRVIKNLEMENKEFLKQVMENFTLEVSNEPYCAKDEQIGMFLDNQWYILYPKQNDFGSIEKNLEVSILQDLLISPILGIEDIRKSDNIFFVGGIIDPLELQKYVTEKGNAIVFSLPAVKIAQIEDVADKNGVMPPKSTWFDPKLLSGLVFNPLE